ncbi:hypothetical protein ZWY2020_021329 [Hordeum vulgare]|nr:hypothetical protein ZWY2020_021329 [Hordeum vulgare]
MPKPPPLLEVPRRKTVPRIDILDDDDDDASGAKGGRSGSPERGEGGRRVKGGRSGRSERGHGGGRAKGDRSGSRESVREGPSVGGRAAVRSPPPRRNPVTASRPSTVRFGASNPTSIKLDSDEEDIRDRHSNMVSARDHGRGADPLSDSEDSRARARKRPAASSPGCSRKVKKRRRESSSGAKGHGAVAGVATRSVDGRRKNKRLEAVRRPRSHHSSDDGWLRRSGHGGGDRARRDAAPARQVGAFAASSSRSRNGDRGKVAAKHAASVVSEDSVEEGDGEEMEGTSSDDNGRFGRRVRHDAAVASRNRSRSGGRRTRTVVTDDSGDDDEDEETGSSDDNDEESRDDEEEDVMKGTNTDGDSGDSDEEEEGVMRGMNKDDESDDNEEEEDVDSEDDDDAVMRRNNEGKSKENVDVMKGKNNENNNGNSNGRCKSVEKEAGGEDDGNSTHDDSSDANADEEESNDTTQTETEEEEEEEEEEESDEAGQDRRVASSRNGETGQDSTHDDSSDANADEEESNDTTQTETETEEEEATEEEEEEESDGAGQDRRVASSRNGETGQDPRVAPSSNGEASGRTRRAVDGLPRVRRRKFEGMWLVEEADTTTPPPGRGLSKRTRSHLSCSNKKLLKLGSVTKPVLLDTSSSGSESEPEEVVPPPQPSSWAAEDGSAGEGRRPAKKKTRRCWQQIAQGGRSENDNSDDPDDDRTPPRKARKGPSSSKPKIGASNRQQTAAKAGGKTHHGSSTNPRRFFKTRAANAADGRGLQDDICFQKSSLSHRKGKRQAEEDIPANDLLASIFDGIPSYLDGSAPADAQGGGCDTMPLVFKFGEEAEVKSEHDELEDQLWEDCDFALQDVNANAHSSEEVEESQGQDIPADQKTLCSQGKHDLVTNDQIGTWCRHCPFLLEIKYVMAPMGNCSAEREPTLARELNIDIINGILTTMGYEGEYVIGSHKSGPVWNLIPGVREDMFPHQQEAFEFLWKKLAGGIDIEQVKQIVETDALSGCVISHAPGTGKTRLAITFVQSYLELFPQCFPVIIAPKGMLDTWETEFRKWNVKIPFHVLSSSDIHWHGDMTVERLASNDKEFARKLSINSIDWNYMRALKLRSWAEGSSIVGLSYSLFRNLTKGEGNDADKKRILAEMEKHKGSTLDLEYKISLASVHPSLVAGMKNLPEEVTSVVDQLPLERLRLKPSEGVKTRFVYEVVRLCQALKERVLVFSQFLQPLDLIMEQLRREFNWTKGKEILVMSGHVSSKTRKPLMAAFNDMESEAKVMLASTKACGEGITLVGASRVVLLDVVWNPSVGRQAVGRAYRIGQQKVVHSYNLIAEGTQEKAKYDSQTKKDQMSKMLFSMAIKRIDLCVGEPVYLW